MARTFGTHFVITANLTDDGAPVYLTEAGEWSRKLSDAHATEAEPERDTLLAHAAEQERAVCDPYAMKVHLEGGTPVASTARELIRATGPTTPLRRPDDASATA